MIRDIIESLRCPGALALTAAVLSALALPTRAREGLIEINQAAALAGGVTASDTADFPVTIDAAGSYRLTGDLTVSDENTTAIRILADDVAIDLNGHAILGVVACSGRPVTSCSAYGSGDGIVSLGNRITIRNGTIRGMGNDGILGGPDLRIDGVTVEENAQYGIECGSDGCMISRTVAAANGGIGISANGGAVRDSLARHNGGAGISAIRCTVVNNSSSNNFSHGMYALSLGTVVGNSLIDNGGFGLSTGTGTGYAGNVISGNGAGTVTGSGVEMGTNLCDGFATCP